jgi:hypothetical protein
LLFIDLGSEFFIVGQGSCIGFFDLKAEASAARAWVFATLKSFTVLG